jgi:catechol 2,3-dioxygenase-like lactoylglutathione lyase family enzyme
MTLLAPEDQFHVGIVVDDFEASRQWFTDTLGYEFGADVALEYTMITSTGPITYDQRLSYSVTEPRIELVQAAAGTPLVPSSSGLHHFGYWCADIEGTSALLVDQGWAWECGGVIDDAGTPAWAYHFNPLGVRVELVSTVMQEMMQALWTPVGQTGG